MELSDVPEKIPSDWGSIPGPNSLDVLNENQVLPLAVIRNSLANVRHSCKKKCCPGKRQTFLYKEMLPWQTSNIPVQRNVALANVKLSCTKKCCPGKRQTFLYKEMLPGKRQTFLYKEMLPWQTSNVPVQRNVALANVKHSCTKKCCPGKRQTFLYKEMLPLEMSLISVQRQ
jgi:hypothetical protein